MAERELASLGANSNNSNNSNSSSYDNNYRINRQNDCSSIPSALSALVVQTDASGKSTFQQPSYVNNSQTDSRAPSPLRISQPSNSNLMQQQVRDARPTSVSRGFFGFLCCGSNEAVVEGNTDGSKDVSTTTVSTTSSSDDYENRRWDGRDGRPSPGSRKQQLTPAAAAAAAYERARCTPPPAPYSRAQRNDRPLTPQQRQVPSLLGAIQPRHEGKLCLVLDLDETLVHSSFQPVKADFIIPVTIENVQHSVYVIKRPGVDEFLERASRLFEIVIYTASLSKYADPLLDKLDRHKVISSRLFREHCVFHQGHYVKDLSLLNRDVNRTIIVDNSSMSYVFHPAHAIDCLSFIDDPRDTDLWKIIDFLEHHQDKEDVRPHCMYWRQWVAQNPSSIPKNYQHLEPGLKYIHKR